MRVLEEIKGFIFDNSTVIRYPAAQKAMRKLVCEQITHSLPETDLIEYRLDQNVPQFTELVPRKVHTDLINRIQNVQ